MSKKVVIFSDEENDNEIKNETVKDSPQLS